MEKVNPPDGCRPVLDVEGVIRGQPFGRAEVERFEGDGLPKTHETMYRGWAMK